VYPLLERPLPWLCADRVDYFLRDAIGCGVLDRGTAATILDHLVVIDGTIAFDDPGVARTAVERFSVMNRGWWASPTEAYIYNAFADALREGLRLGALTVEDLFSDDAHVLARLRSADSPAIEGALARIGGFRPDYLRGFEPKIEPKARQID